MSDPDLAVLRSAAAYADSWLAVQTRRLRVPGVQAAVRVGGELLLSTAHGVADEQLGTPLTPAHLFRIASHSKTFTATALLQLVEADRVRLDDRIGDLLPRLAGSRIARRSVRELLAHDGGLTRDGERSDHWQLAVPFPDVETLYDVAGAPSAAVLGAHERFKYSNIGYSLLGLVIETVTGTRYAEHLRTAVLEPLGLHDTAVDFDASRAAEYATGHSALAYADRRRPIDHVDTRAMAAATGFVSTAADLVSYAVAHAEADTRLLTEESKRLLQHEIWGTGGRAGGYGLGFARTEIGGRWYVGHGGGFPGHITSTLLDPQRALAVSVLTNAIDGPAALLASGVVRLLTLTDSPPADGVSAVPAGVDVSRFAGRYADLWQVLDIVVLGQRVFAVDPADEEPGVTPTEFRVVDDRTLQVVGGPGYGAPGETARFEFDGDGRVRSMRNPGGQRMLPLTDYQATIAGVDRITLPEQR